MPVVVGIVIVPVFVIEEITGDVKVLFVKVSVVARPTRVSVEDGRVNVPVLLIVLIIGLVKVLLVNVSVPARVANVPLVGSVTLVVDVVVKVVANAPEVVKLPPSVIVLPELFTPVPPYCPATRVPCQVPVPIVPTVVKLEVTTAEPRVVAFRTEVPAI